MMAIIGIATVLASLASSSIEVIADFKWEFAMTRAFLWRATLNILPKKKATRISHKSESAFFLVQVVIKSNQDGKIMT